VSGILVFAYTAGVTAVNVSDSIISGGADGVFALATAAGAASKAFITRCTISGAGWGIESQISGAGSALIVIGSSMITNNYYGWYQHPGATIESLGNNLFRENTTNVGSLTPVAPQ
jgi:hypothetical protein